MITPMNIKIDINNKEIEQEAQAKILRKVRDTIENTIIGFFGISKDIVYNGTRNEIISTKGDGLKEIEDYVANRFLDPKFKEKMDRFFDQNWERIFEECMTKAIQHKANAAAFAKTKEK